MAKSDPKASNTTLQNSIVEELLGLVEAEADAPPVAGAAVDAKRSADLWMRAALLHWDGKGQAERAGKLLAKVDHPLAPSVRLGVALTVGELGELTSLAADARRRGDKPELAELATFLLWSRGSLDVAGELFRLAGDEGRLGRRLCLAIAGRWADLVDMLGEARDADSIIEAASIAHDRLDDKSLAQKLAQRALERTPRSLPAVEKLLELASETGPPNDLLLAKLSVLGVEASNAIERAAAQFQLAQGLERAGALEEAATAFGQVCASEIEQTFGARLALRMRARLDVVRGEWLRASESYEQLSEQPGSLALQHRYLRRAAQLADAKLEERQRAERLWQRLAERDSTDLEAALALARLRLARNAPIPEALAPLERAARQRRERDKDRDKERDRDALHLVARARELAAGAFASAADLEPSIALWKLTIEGAFASPATNASSDELDRADRTTLDTLVRLYRRAGDRGQLAAVYRRLAATADPRRASAILSVAGALALDAGVTFEAEQCFDASAAHNSDDLLVHAGRALLHQRTNKSAALKSALEAMLGQVRSKGAQARLYRQLAQLALDGDRDLRRATEHFEKALALQPDDWLTIYALAQLASEAESWARAVELLERAAGHAEGARAAALLVEAAQLLGKRIGDDERARAVYEKALVVWPTHGPALDGLADLHRKHRRGPELLEIYRKQLSVAQDRDTQLGLRLEIAQLAEGLDVEPRIALEAYRDALRIDPGNPLGLQGTARLCRKLRLWDILLEVAERAPRSVTALELRGEALGALGRWADLAKVRENELGLLTEPTAVAAAARELASLYEQRLNDLEGAARAWHRVDEVETRKPDAARALQRLYTSLQRWQELASALERELQLGNDLNEKRRLELWLELGRVRREKLSKLDVAAEAFEHALLVDSQNQPALTALSDVYSSMSRGTELNRVLDLRAAASSDPHERAAVLLRKGELLEREEQQDAAFDAYRQSFELDPASRASFTAYERACFRRERWTEAASLYDRAIKLVEVDKSRAYRLVDLYARKAQLLLQYLQNPAQAAEVYRKVVELDPDSDAAQNALERIHSADGSWGALIAMYERRSELVHDDARRSDILRRAARIASAKLRDPVETSRLYERLHAVDPTDAEALDALEKYYDKNRDWNRLVEILRTKLAFTVEPVDTMPILVRLAKVHEDGLRDAEHAVESYAKVLEVDPVHRDALEALSRLYESTERWAELIEVTRRLIRLVTDRAQKAILYFKCGSVTELKFGREDDAIRYYEAAIRTSPACLPAVHGLRDLHLRRQDWARVIQTLELEAKLWTDDKERAGVFAHIGNLYGQRLEDEERAIQYYESALRVDAECLPANRSLFDLYFARGEFARCVPLVSILTQKVAREGDPVERSSFYRKRAVVAERTHDPRGAAEAFVVALEVWPENIDALEALVTLCRKSTTVYDFGTTFGELEKIYRKRGLSKPLARVLVAQGSLRDATYDVDGAEQLYLEAFKLDPDEYQVVDALVALHERWRRFDAGATVLEAFIDRATSRPSRTSARLRLAELYSDGAMDPARAAQTLEDILDEDATHVDARFRIAQELYLRGQLPIAMKHVALAVEQASEVQRGIPDRDRARMHAFQARLLDASGDAHGATRAYRTAIDLDRACLPACIALARRAASVGDMPATLALIDEAQRLARSRSTEEELDLVRALARFYVSIDERGRSVDCYRTVLATAPDSADDRIALGELLAQSEDAWPQAREELLTVVNRSPRYAPAYRALQQLYVRANDFERAGRVAASLQLLGFSDPSDRTGSFRSSVRRGSLPDDLRRAFLQVSGTSSAYSEALGAARETLDQIYGLPTVAGAVPWSQVADPSLKLAVPDTLRMVGINAEVFIAPSVPGQILLQDEPKPAVFLEASLLSLGDSERRFLLGRCLEVIRQGCGLFTRLRVQARDEVTGLLEQLVRPEDRRTQQALDFVRGLPKKAQRSLEKLSTLERPSFDAIDWLERVERTANRAGLLACDDVAGGVSLLAQLRGVVQPGAEAGTALLGEVQGGADLVAFFLSDEYHALRSSLVA